MVLFLVLKQKANSMIHQFLFDPVDRFDTH